MWVITIYFFRLTNQLGDNNMEMVREIFKKMNEEYTGVMRRFNSRGAVSMWDRSKPSVWLTAWTLQIFRDVAFQVQMSWDYSVFDALFRIGRTSSTSIQTLSATPRCGYSTTSRLMAPLLRLANQILTVLVINDDG